MVHSLLTLNSIISTSLGHVLIQFSIQGGFCLGHVGIQLIIEVLLAGCCLLSSSTSTSASTSSTPTLETTTATLEATSTGSALPLTSSTTSTSTP